MKKGLKITLIVIAVPIALLLIAFFVLFIMPIGINPADSVMKSVNNSYIYNGVTYSSEKELDFPVDNCFYEYKGGMEIKELYPRKFKAIMDSTCQEFLIGDRIINQHFTDAFLSDVFHYIDTSLIEPELTTENVKKIEKCNKLNELYGDPEVIGQGYSGDKVTNSFHTELPKDSSVYSLELDVLETFTEPNDIAKLIKLFNEEVPVNSSEDTEPWYWYRVEFTDESFPFYLIVERH